MLGNIGGLISTWSFLPTDAPNFHIGNGCEFFPCWTKTYHSADPSQ
jgi:hypothetical protein